MPVQKGAADAAARLIAKYGKSAVNRAIKAANTPAKGDKAQSARDFGKLYTEYKKMPAKQREKNVMARVYKYNTPKGKTKGPQTAEDITKMKKALVNNVNSKNLKGKINSTKASQRSTPLERAKAYERDYNKRLKK
jgi:hypothetical protein